MQHKYRWDRDLSLKFVKKYMELDILWNMEHPLRSNAKARLKALTELKNLVGDPNFTIDEVRKKIKSFRTTYTMELRKIRKSKNQAYVPTINWFKIMDERLRGPTMENIVKTWRLLQNSRDIYLDHDYKKATSSTDDQNHQNMSIKRSNSEDEEDEEMLEERLEDSFQDDSCNEQNQTDEQRQKTPSPSPPPAKKIKYQYSSTPQKNCRTKRKLTPVITSTSVVQPQPSIYNMEDEFDLFGKSVAIQLRKLPLSKALKAQLDIHTLLVNARLNDQHGNTTMETATIDTAATTTREEIFQIEEYDESNDA